jgi:hypothetical protein
VAGKRVRKYSLPVAGVVVALVAGACVGPTKPPPPPEDPHRDVVLFGDSNADGIGCVLGDPSGEPPFPCTGQPDFSAQNESTGACSIAGGLTLLYLRWAYPPGCHDWASTWPGILAERTPRLVILGTGGWEITDRWINFPSAPGCSTSDAFNCPAPDYQWGDPNNHGPAAQRYGTQLAAAIGLFRSWGAKVLVLSSPYYAPVEPQVPGVVDVWYERYLDDGGTGTPGVDDWVAPNTHLTYRPSEVKTDQFNATVEAVIAAINDPNVRFFDLWERVSPVNPATQDEEYNDFSCFPPNEKLWPQTSCPGSAMLARGLDHGHFEHAAYVNVIMPYLYPVIRSMLS